MSYAFRAAAAALMFGVLALLGACAESPTAPGAPGVASAPGAPGAVTDEGAPGARPTAAMPSPVAAAVPGCDGAAVVLNAEEARTLALHNGTRRALGLAEFCVDAVLTAAARAHSREMLAKGYFSHDSFDGTSFDVRIRALGFPARRGLAENAAWGTGVMGEADDVFARFMASPSHHHNIVDPTLRRIGVGVAAGTYQGRTGARMYTVDFGTL